MTFYVNLICDDLNVGACMLQIITARAAKRKETVEASTPAKKQKVEEPEGDGKETPAKKQKVEEPEGDGKETMDTAETKAKVVVSLINVGVSYYRIH